MSSDIRIRFLPHLDMKGGNFNIYVGGRMWVIEKIRSSDKALCLLDVTETLKRVFPVYSRGRDPEPTDFEYMQCAHGPVPILYLEVKELVEKVGFALAVPMGKDMIYLPRRYER